MSSDESAPRDGDFVQSLDRGLAVIRAFTTDHSSLTLSEVARSTGISRAAARRFLHTLVELEYLGTDGRTFYLRPRLLEIGHAYLSSLGLPQIAQPHLRRLADQVGESTSVAVLDDQDIVYVARVAFSRIMSVSISVGTRFPAYATSMGRAIVACGSEARREQFLADCHPAALTDRTITDIDELRSSLAVAREQGWAYVDQELEAGLRSVAAPIRDASGEVIAAVNVAEPTRGSAEGIAADTIAHTLDAARRIEEDLIRVGTRIR